ncbi:MAG: SIR2 family protein [Carboxylicivirga sp.]|jgi:hypothetical protein|nr:SIR2 family protein [Carboxylicivirga sp.]
MKVDEWRSNTKCSAYDVYNLTIFVPMALSLDHVYEEIQGRLSRKTVLIAGTGTSMALDVAFGMWALEKHLKAAMPDLLNSDDEKAQWQGVLSRLQNNEDFESSLSEVQSEFLLENIIKETANHVIQVSCKHYNAIQSGKIDWPLQPLLEKLRQALPPTNPVLDIITPNYDLLIEYTLGAIGLNYTDGFIGGLQKELNWSKAKEQFYRLNETLVRGKKQVSYSVIPHARLFKVHGSLNYCQHSKKILRDDTIAFQQDEIQRVIITPGKTKYQRIIEEGYDLHVPVRDVLKQVQTFLFAGYGFNDTDIDKQMAELAAKPNYEAIIVTKDLGGQSENMIKENPGIIVVCQNDDHSSKVLWQKEELIVDKKIWEIDTFAKEILY